MMLETIHHYTIIEELGSGGMATVLLADDPRFERQVAIKVIKREYVADADFRARFTREAKTIAALEHSAIVPVHDYGDHEGQPYLVMRYMAGGALADRLSPSDPLPPAEVARIFARLARAIDYAHAEGVIHRDLKPENIFFDKQGDAYVGDFGIALPTQDTTELTQGDPILGTLAYMSPEQLRGEALDHRSDLYVLGVILFEMLAGRHPFPVLDSLGYIHAHLHEPTPDIRTFNPHLPPDVTSVIEAAMAKDPAERYDSAQAMVDDLRWALESDDDDELVALPEPESRGRLTWIVGGVLAVALLIGGLALGGVFGGGAADASPEETPDPDLVVRITATPRPTVRVEVTATPALTPTPTATPSLAEVMPVALRQSRIVFVSNLHTTERVAQHQAGGSVPTHNTDPAGADEIYLMNADGTNLTRLTVNEADEHHPRWSPDGTQIVFASERDGDWEIYVMDVDGLNVMRLTASPGLDDEPDWSPDGSRIAFVSERDGNREIYIMNADGSDPVRVTNHDARDESPDWSPDGSQLVFASSRHGTDDLFVIDADISDLNRLTQEANHSDRAPVWSPDGSQIAFLSDREGGQEGEVYVLDVATREVTPLTATSSVPPLDFSWSPDQEWVVVRLEQAHGGNFRRVVMIHIASGAVYELMSGDVDFEDFDWYGGP